MKILIIIWALVIGSIVPLQAIINSRLSAEVGGATQAALISFTGGFFIFVAIGLINYSNLPSIGKVTSLNPVLLTGGIIGAVFVLSAIMIVPKLGAVGWTALIVAGQLLSSIVMDHFGFFGLEVKPINAYRIIGAISLILGSTLITRF